METEGRVFVPPEIGQAQAREAAAALIRDELAAPPYTMRTMSRHERRWYAQQRSRFIRRLERRRAPREEVAGRLYVWDIRTAIGQIESDEDRAAANERFDAALKLKTDPEIMAALGLLMRRLGLTTETT